MLLLLSVSLVLIALVLALAFMVMLGTGMSKRDALTVIVVCLTMFIGAFGIAWSIFHLSIGGL